MHSLYRALSARLCKEWKQTMAQIKKFGGRCTSKFKECPCAYADTYQIIFRPRREPENCAIKEDSIQSAQLQGLARVLKFCVMRG